MVCIGSTRASLSANLLCLGGVVSIGTLLQGAPRDVKLSIHNLNFLEPPLLLIRKVQVDYCLLSQYHSGGGHLSQPSKTLCTHICGLQVAVAVGLEGDPLGRKDLELPASAPIVLVAAKVVGTVEVMARVEAKVVLPVVVVSTSS